MFNRKYIFNGSIFRCYVSLPECNKLQFETLLDQKSLTSTNPTETGIFNGPMESMAIPPIVGHVYLFFHPGLYSLAVSPKDLKKSYLLLE